MSDKDKLKLNAEKNNNAGEKKNQTPETLKKSLNACKIRENSRYSLCRLLANKQFEQIKSDVKILTLIAKKNKRLKNLFTKNGPNKRLKRAIYFLASQNSRFDSQNPSGLIIDKLFPLSKGDNVSIDYKIKEIIGDQVMNDKTARMLAVLSQFLKPKIDYTMIFNEKNGSAIFSWMDKTGVEFGESIKFWPTYMAITVFESRKKPNFTEREEMIRSELKNINGWLRKIRDNMGDASSTELKTYDVASAVFLKKLSA